MPRVVRKLRPDIIHIYNKSLTSPMRTRLWEPRTLKAPALQIQCLTAKQDCQFRSHPRQTEFLLIIYCPLFPSEHCDSLLGSVPFYSQTSVTPLTAVSWGFVTVNEACGRDSGHQCSMNPAQGDMGQEHMLSFICSRRARCKLALSAVRCDSSQAVGENGVFQSL